MRFYLLMCVVIYVGGKVVLLWAGMRHELFQVEYRSNNRVASANVA